MAKRKTGTTIKRGIIFIIKFIKKVFDDDILGFGAQLAYHLVLAFVPFLIFLVTLIGYSNLNSADVLMFLEKIMPIAAYQLIQSTVIEVVDVQQSGLLWISIVLAIWVSSSGFSAVIKGLNRAYGVKETRSYIRLKIASILYTILLAATILATLFLFVFGDVIKNMLGRIFENAQIIMMIWNISRYLIVVVVLIGVFAFLYNVTPCIRLGWSDVLPGAAITTLGWVVTSLIFAFYVNNFSNYSRLYGGLGAVFILMTWIFLSSVILLLGGEINAALTTWNK